MNFKIFSIITLIILAVVFILQNVTEVEVNLFLWHIKISRALLIVINLLIGFLLGWFIKSYTGYKNSKNNKSVEKQSIKPKNPDQDNS